MKHEMLVVVDEFHERVTGNFVGGHFPGEALNENFLILMARKITLSGEDVVDAVFAGKDGVDGEPAEAARSALGVGGCVAFGRQVSFGHNLVLSFANLDVLTGVGFLRGDGLCFLAG